MRIDILLELRDKLKNNKISYHDAYEIIKTLPEPWKETEWKNDRSVILKDCCEKCNTKDGPFVIQHTKHPRKFSLIRERKALELMKNDINDFDAYFHCVLSEHVDRVVDTKYELKLGCPKCKSLSIRTRKTLTPKYVCKCNHSFEEPETVKYYPIYCCSEGAQLRKKIIEKDYIFIRKKIIYDYIETHDELIGKHSLIDAINESLEYISLVHTKTYCKKCAYIEDLPLVK